MKIYRDEKTYGASLVYVFLLLFKLTDCDQDEPSATPKSVIRKSRVLLFIMIAFFFSDDFSEAKAVRTFKSDCL